jgi:hypothetical protein
MQFSIYDYKNMFLDGTEAAGSAGNLLYVGTTAEESAYQYMKPGPAGKEYPSGGEVKSPYAVEFRITETSTATANGATTVKPMVLTVYGAAAVTGADGKPVFAADKSPAVPAAFEVVGQLTLPEPDAEEPAAYRVAVSSNKYKWFKAGVAGGKAAAHLMRG